MVAMPLVVHLSAAASLTLLLPGQSTWTLLSPANRPAQRCCAGMATDMGRGVVWLFGGGPNSGPYANDTWSWNGANWTQVTPANAPTGRYGHTLVFDMIRNRGVLFGGNTNGGLSGETWEWDGTNWLLMSPATSPTARYEHAMAYDLLRTRSVLFGGSTGSAETWEWDGTNWTQAIPPAPPPGRRGHAMAYHLPSQRVVMFGGNLNDTWEWDGTNWLQRQPAVRPPIRIYFSMAEDVVRGCIVMFSGRPGYFIDTWEWDGREWTQRQPVVSIPGRSATMMAFDPAAGAPLLFGGIVLNASPPRFDETWRYTAVSATFARYGNGCAGSAGVPTLDSPTLPWVGRQWPLTLANLPANVATIMNLGLSDTIWNSQPLPAPLAAFGMPGCDLFMSPDVSTLLFATGTSATLNITIPVNASLSGLVVFSQGLVLDPAAANAARAVVSNAGRAAVAVL